MQDLINTEIAEQLRHWTLEQRQEAVAAIAELEAVPGWELIQTVIRGVRRRKMDALLGSDKPREASEYARDLGEIKGIQLLEEVVESIRKKGEEASAQLEQRLAGATA